jgi:hypothetical protein
VSFHAAEPGKRCPKKPRVAEIFKDEDATEDRTGGRQKQRTEDEVDLTTSVSTKEPLSSEFDFSCWTGGDAKKLFVPAAAESAPDCLERRVDSLQRSHR